MAGQPESGHDDEPAGGHDGVPGSAARHDPAGAPGPAGRRGTAGSAGPGRDPRPGGFARHGAGDACPPGGPLAVLLEQVCGPGWRCPGASDDEAAGLLGRWAAMESWAAAGKLGVVRELIRRNARPGGTAPRGDLPYAWDGTLEHQVSLALRTSVAGARKLIDVAWALEARLPRIGQALAAGRLDYGRAKMITEETMVLDEDLCAAAEELILAGMDGCKTWSKLQRLAADAVIRADPDGARKRREQAGRDEARVRFWRETSGTCALAAYGLPADEALAANAHIESRARAYRQAGLRAGIDLLRVMAYCDILNGIPASGRITRARAGADAETGTDAETGVPAGSGAGAGAAGPPGDDELHDDGPRDDGPRDDGPRDDGPRDDGPAGDERAGGPGREHAGGPGREQAGSHGPCAPGDRHRDGTPGGRGPSCAACDGCPRDSGTTGPCAGSCRGGSTNGNGSDDGDRSANAADPARASGAGPEPFAQAEPVLPTRVNLTIPLRTLLHLAEIPGEAHSLGPLDPALARTLAQAAARSPDSEFCVTVTSPQGHAIGHGCARPARQSRREQHNRQDRDGRKEQHAREERHDRRDRDGRKDRHDREDQHDRDRREQHDQEGPDSQEEQHSRRGPDNRQEQHDMRNSGKPPPVTEFTPRGIPGATGGYGTWMLTLPGCARPFTVDLGPVPVYDCDHRHESRGYQPGSVLRHLVQVRDGECTFPACSRHARETDFEHAIPYDQGGRTCGCNAGSRSRMCHQVKQSPGWNLTQPSPGWHQWTTPSGRVYTQGP